MTAVALLDGRDVSQLWADYSKGDGVARERLFAMHYDEFRRVARRVLGGSADRLLVQPTDLAHEAAIRLLGMDRIQLRDHVHFLALSARVMRQTLIDEVRRRASLKRHAPPTMTQWPAGGSPDATFDLEEFDIVLTRLVEIDPERARVVELRFFAGLTMGEIAQYLEVSISTVERHWRGARAWLLNELHDPRD